MQRPGGSLFRGRKRKCKDYIQKGGPEPDQGVSCRSGEGAKSLYLEGYI